nr:uncharacterized protein LOC110145783 [Odocoileus virginianus texanus]
MPARPLRSGPSCPALQAAACSSRAPSAGPERGAAPSPSLEPWGLQTRRRGQGLCPEPHSQRWTGCVLCAEIGERELTRGPLLCSPTVSSPALPGVGKLLTGPVPLFAGPVSPQALTFSAEPPEPGPRSRRNPALITALGLERKARLHSGEGFLSSRKPQGVPGTAFGAGGRDGDEPDDCLRWRGCLCVRHSHKSGGKRNKDDVIQRDKRASQLEKRYSASHMRKWTRSHEIARFSSRMGGQGCLSADRGKRMEGTILRCWWEGEFGTFVWRQFENDRIKTAPVLGRRSLVLGIPSAGRAHCCAEAAGPGERRG